MEIQGLFHAVFLKKFLQKVFFDQYMSFLLCMWYQLFLSFCGIYRLACENLLFWFIYLLPSCRKISKEKIKKRILVCSVLFSAVLTDYFDLTWCFYDDLWRTSVFPDDTNDLHLSTQVVSIWRIWESWKIAGKDYSSTILVVFVKIEKTYCSGVVGIYDCPLNNYVLIAVVVSFCQAY